MKDCKAPTPAAITRCRLKGSVEQWESFKNPQLASISGGKTQALQLPYMLKSMSSANTIPSDRQKQRCYLR